MKALSSVLLERLMIIAEQTSMPNIGTSGTSGVLNGLTKPGLV